MSMMSATRLQPRRSRERGITLIGLLFWAVVLCSCALVVMKVVPAVTEYRTILGMVNKAAHEGGSTVPEIRNAFERSRSVEYGVTSIKSRDLEITKEGSEVVIAFGYRKEVPLFGGVGLYIDYSAKTKQ